MAKTNRSTPLSTDPPAVGPIARPPFQLRSLPVRHRWEVTRRHPYYQLWWESARAQHRNLPTEHPAEIYLRQAAVAILAMIGVSGEPPDPASDFEQIGADQLNAAWKSGVIHPISLRGMAELLLASLPAETLNRLGTILTQASHDDHDDAPPHRIEALIALQTLDKPGLDLYPDEPLVSINPAASGRQMEAAASALLKEWKSERGLSGRRDRADNYDEYLRVWDLREGWRGGAYDRKQERRLREVAKRLNVHVNTVHNQYCSAFSLIVGHRYSPELWYRAFGMLKLSALTGASVGEVSRRRPLKSRTRIEVAESVVCSESEEEEGHPLTLTSGSVGADDKDLLLLVEDIGTLIAKKLTDKRIAEELGLSEAAIECIATIRKRGGDLL